jgi:hypothetical protein
MRTWVGRFGAWLIRLWLRIVGRTVRKSDVPWLLGPIGAQHQIGDTPYAAVARAEGLMIDASSPGRGLVADWGALVGPGCEPARAHPEVRRFYEDTAAYVLDVWCESRFPGRLFLWLLVSTVSRTMNQLNFPVFGLDTARGMTSEVLALRRPDGSAAHTGWLRRRRDDGRVIYTGFYSMTRPPRHDGGCIKVVFPLPRGNATVVLRPGVDEQGRFTLTSSGRRFGDPGFYRVLELDRDRLKVRYLRTLREHFEVYVDSDGDLRCDHRVRFLGMTMLRLHYRMLRSR